MKTVAATLHHHVTDDVTATLTSRSMTSQGGVAGRRRRAGGHVVSWAAAESDVDHRSVTQDHRDDDFAAAEHAYHHPSAEPAGDSTLIH